MDFRENEVSDYFEWGYCFEFIVYFSVYLKY